MTLTIGDALLYVTALGASLSVLIYSRVPWWRTPIGRHAMAYMAAIAAVVDMAAVRHIFGPYWIFDQVRAATYASVGFVIWWRLVVLVKARRVASKRPEQEKECHRGGWVE